MSEAPPQLPPQEAARLTEFARACKAAARAVALYPPAHPAIATTLARIADQTSVAALPAALRLTVLPDLLLLDGRAPARVDLAVGELASLLHSHLVGEITIHPGGDTNAWRTFLLLLARTPDTIRSEGGIARLWTTTGVRHVELRQIDYAEVLRERSSGETGTWDRVIAACLEGDGFDLTAEAMQMLLEIAGDEQRLGELIASLDEDSARSIPARTAALMRLLRGVLSAVRDAGRDTAGLEVRNIASVMGRISPEMMLEFLGHRASEAANSDSPSVIDEIIGQMSDQTVAGFITRSVATEGSATERLAQAFQALVPDPDRRHRVIDLSRDVAAASPLGQTDGFESLWETVANLLRSYSDASFVSDAYARELSDARTQALEVERVGDDPPDRRAAWLGTVSASAVRALDLTLLLDLLRIEDDAAKWRRLMTPTVAHVEDLLLVGDFEAADKLVAVLIDETGTAGSPARQPAALAARDRLASGVMMRHIVSHLPTIDDAHFERVVSVCTRFGEPLVRPLAEALSTEERGRTRERLTALLIAFGASGRQTVERLKHSPNPAVRRTAVYLLREFGGTDALPDLTLLLDDDEPQVQREAVRAILNIGTDAAYQVLQQALTTGTPQSRDAIMQTISLVRDERATPLFAYILSHVDYRGPLRGVYMRAIESLGALRDSEAVPVLKMALYRGDWWAPRRTAAARAAAAQALARIGTPSAIEVLREAESSGRRALRTVVRPALSRALRESNRI